MILSDTDLKKRGTQIVEPFDPGCIQPSSYDVALEGRLAVPKPYKRVDLRTDEPGDHMAFESFKEYELHPRQAVLACTREVVRVPVDLSARVEGKSSLGRLFLSVHITAGVLDAGFEGQVTLEIVNHGPWTIVLWPGMKIAQISFFKMTTVCEVPYGSGRLGSHYLGQKGPTPAAGRRDLEKLVR